MSCRAKCFYIPRNQTQICSCSRRQQRHQGGGGGKNPPLQTQQQSPQHQRDLSQQQSPNLQQQNSTELGDNRNGGAARPPRQYPGGHGPRQGGHSQNRRWHPSQKGQGQGQTTLPGDKGASPRTNRETEAEPARGEEDTGAPVDIAATCPGQPPESKPATNASPVLMPNKEAPPGSEKTSEGQPEKPKISLLQSSKERLRRRLKDKVPKSCLLPVRAYYSSQA